MSRPDSKSPETSPALPRRSILKALAAAPAAVALASGDAMSAPMNPEWAQDDRFVKTDRLMNEVNESYDGFLAMDGRDADVDDDGENIYEIAQDRWYEAQQALRDYAIEFSNKASKDLVDVLVLTRIADFHLLDEADYIDGIPASVSAALRATLELHGVAGTEKTASSIEHVRFEAEIARRPAEPPTASGGVNAGNFIRRARELAEADREAYAFADSLKEGTPESDRARKVSDRKLEELEAIVGEFISWRRTGSMNTVEELTVLCELICALRPGFWEDTAEAEARGVGPLLFALKQLGTFWTDEYLERAERWNAEHGGVNA